MRWNTVLKSSCLNCRSEWEFTKVAGNAFYKSIEDSNTDRSESVVRLSKGKKSFWCRKLYGTVFGRGKKPSDNQILYVFLLFYGLKHIIDKFFCRSANLTGTTFGDL